MAASFFCRYFLGKVPVEHAKGGRLIYPDAAADPLLPNELHFRVDALSEIVILRAIPDDERMWTLQSTYVWLCPSTCCECAAQAHAQSDMRTSLGSPPSATGRW